MFENRKSYITTYSFSAVMPLLLYLLTEKKERMKKSVNIMIK